jgi:beta-N-acetylhexosaminidase
MRWGILLILFTLVSIFENTALKGTGKDSWVTETLAKLTVEEKIGQLMMVEVRPSKGRNHMEDVDSLITKYKVGGVIFFKTDPQNLFLTAQKYQSMAKVPLLVAIDGEWGVSMRLDNTIVYPFQIGLGGIQDETLIYKMGRDIGKQCKRLGIHVNFAPDIDVNNNPENPVINFRSFGEDPMNVARKGWQYAKGMQHEGIIACAKHFPGHGDTKTDSHKDLPIISHGKGRLDSVELKPFQYLIDSGIMSIMTAHVFMPAIDSTPNTPISLSPIGVDGLLKKEMGFRGLAFTDAMDMQGAAKYYPPGQVELKALLAGNDILLCPANVPRAIDTLKAAVADGRLSMQALDAKVRKILEAKAFAGLDLTDNAYYPNLIEDLNNSDALNLHQKLVENIICVAKNDSACIPLFNNPYKRMAVLALGGSGPTTFEKKIKEYGNCDIFDVGKSFGVDYCTNIVSKLEVYDLVVIGLHQINKYPKDNYGITTDACSLVSQLKAKTKVALVCFGNPYSMINFEGLHSTVFAFGDDEPYYKAAAEAIWGIKKADARLSVSVGKEYPRLSGKTLYKSDKLMVGATTPSKQKKLSKIDSIVKNAIASKATPGCQVLVAQNGKTIYYKSFGYQSYDNAVKVENNQLYDLASITKVAATTLAVMKLYENQFIKLDDTLSWYLPELKGSNKENITVRQVLVHEAGLKDFIPFQNSINSNSQLRDSVLSNTRTDKFCYEVNDGLFVNKAFASSMLMQIANSNLGTPGKFVYSDLGMIMLKIMIERITQRPFETYLDEIFYGPMGLKLTTFRPRDKFEKSLIVPTEKDPDFRKGLVQGYVHDPAAALQGGVSGNAGLFSNAYELAEIGQMLLNNGFYNGKRFLKPSTIAEFTARQSEGSRRGLGFDKPENTAGKSSPASKYASNSCFGHTGFTGTCIWVDPETKLVFVFLSNRINPSADNRALITKNVRTDIMDVIYESIMPGK